jgi:hypothetical protein
VKPGLVGKRFLADALGVAQLSKIPGETLANIDHRPPNTALSPMYLQTMSDVAVDFASAGSVAPSLIVCICHEAEVEPERQSPSQEAEPTSVAAGPGEGSSASNLAVRKFTSKQMGDACEMLVAAELTLAGIPALKVPDNWPHYDVIAQPLGQPAQRISVKSRTFKTGAAFVEYNDFDQFDWLAIVLLNGLDCSRRAIYLVPRTEADRLARQDKPTSKTAHLRYYRIDEVDRLFSTFRNNFRLEKITTL